MFSKRCRKLVLFFFILLANPALGRELSTTVQKEVSFLSSLRDLVILVHQVNRAHARGYIACMEGNTNAFPYQYPANRKEWKISLRDCKATLQVVLRDRIRSMYGPMRLALALSGPEYFSRSNAAIENVDSTNRIKFNEVLVHPAGKNAAPLDRLTPDEVQAAFKKFHEGSKPGCEEYLRKRPQLRVAADFCNIYSLDAQERAMAKAHAFNSPDAPIVQKYFGSHSKIWKDSQNKYFELIQNFPVLLYLRSDSPSDAELTEALQQIRDNADEAHRELREKDQELGLEGRLEAFHAGKTTEKMDDYLSADLRFYLDYTPLLGYFLSLYAGELERLSIGKEIIKPMIEAHEGGQAFFNLIKNVGLIAMSFSCALIPEERVVAILLSGTALRGGCFAAMNVSLGAYMVSDLRLMEREAIIKTLSSPEGKYVMADLRRLRSTQADQILATVFLGIGSLQGVRELIRLYK
ncbi:hypothetical protein K2X30_13425 [bacterium]|jgi:ribosome modulation factor|nr:hypothetical protein [bacterium]